MKPIPGFERYAADAEGNIWSMCDKANPRKLSVSGVHNGYLRVGLTKDRKTKMYRVHRLVLSAYVGPCPKNHEGSHINGDRTDNRACNLIWESKKQNLSRRWGHGTMRAGTMSISCKLGEEDVKDILKRLEQGDSKQSLSRKFAVCPATIYDITIGKNWAWLTGIAPKGNRGHRIFSSD